MNVLAINLLVSDKCVILEVKFSFFWGIQQTETEAKFPPEN